MQEQEITTISKIFKVSSEHIIAFYYTPTSFNCFSKTTGICFTGKEVIFKRKEDEVLMKINYEDFKEANKSLLEKTTTLQDIKFPISFHNLGISYLSLVQILSKFNNGESLSAQELTQEFNVDTRTIQRDLNERLTFMPIKKENGRYVLESFALGKLSFKDIQNFATLSGIAELYPKLDQGFIVDLLSCRVNKVLMVKNEGFQKVDYELFKDLSVAILKHNVLNFFYKDKERQIKPYKLVNYKGIWYLLGDENDKLKHFNLDKISKLRTKNENFIPNENFKNKSKVILISGLEKAKK